MAVETLGSEATAKIVREAEHDLVISAPTKRTFALGEMVEIDTDGEFATVSTPAKAIGPVITTNSEAGPRVSVHTPFVAEARVKANGQINAGGLVKFDPSNSNSDDEAVYTAASSSDLAHGIAAEDIGDGNQGRIYIFKNGRVAP